MNRNGPDVSCGGQCDVRPGVFAEKCPPVKFRSGRWRGSPARVARATPRTGITGRAGQPRLLRWFFFVPVHVRPHRKKSVTKSVTATALFTLLNGNSTQHGTIA